MAQQIFGPAAVVSTLNRALANTSPSNAVFTNQIAQAGTTVESQLAFAKQFGASYAAGKTAADLSALLMTNLGLSNALLAAALTDYIAANGTQNVGIIAYQLANLLSALEADATYGAAAKAWNTEVTTSYEYSSNPANTTASSGDTTGNEAGKSTVLTVGQDVLTGTSGNDFFRGVAGQPIGAQEQTTFNSSDILDGGAGQDTLILNLVGSYNGGARVKNIETLKLGINAAVTAAFDYNVNAGFNEISDVTTIVADQINGAEFLSVNNIVRTDLAGAKVAPTLSFENDSNTAAAGRVDFNYRAAELTGAADEQKINLKSVNNGDINLSAGFETISITSMGTEQVTLQPGADNAVADVTSGASLRTVNLAGTAEIGKNAGVVAATGLTDRIANGATDLGLTAGATASNLLSVAAVVTKVDASTAEAAVNVRFTNTVASNNTFLGGQGNDYVEFGLGNINANGGAGNDTFAFINGSTNSTFGEGDSIDGGAGNDTIQIGVNGDGTYNISETELRNKSSIGEIDLRGNADFLTLSSDFVSKADTADSITVRTNKISQTSLTVADNAATTAVGNALEDASTHTVNLTMLSSNQTVNFVGGSGSDRIILNDASFNVLKTLEGGKYSPTSATGAYRGYDTITVVTNGENVVIDAQDLSKVSGFEGLVLTKNSAAATYNIELSRAFLNANTEAIDNATNTTNLDNVFHIGTSAAANNSALRAGDTVTIDIRDLLTAADAANVGTRRLDLGALIASGATINLVGNLATYTTGTAPAGLLANNTADHLTVVQTSAAFPGAAPLFFQGTVADESVTLVANGNSVDMGGGADILNTGAALAPTGNLDGGAGVDTLNAANGVNLSGANITNFETLNLNGAATMTAAQYAAFTTVTAAGGADAVTLTTAGAVTGVAAVETYNLSAAGNQITVNGATAQAVNGNVGADTVVASGTSIANKTIALGGGADTLTITGLVTATANAFTLGAASAAGAAVSGVETVNFSNGLINGTGVLSMFNGAATVNLTGNAGDTSATDALQLGTGGQTVNVAGADGFYLAGGAGADGFNLSGVTAGANSTTIGVSGGAGVAFGVVNAIGAVSLVTAFDTITGFRAGVDKIDAVAAGGANALTTINVNVSTSLADLAGTLNNSVSQAIALAATNWDAAGDALLVNITSGTAAGTYFVQNAAADVTFDAGAELVLKLVGTVGVITQADII